MNLHNVKSFELAGITYPVKYVKEVDNDPTLAGMSYLHQHRVEILDNMEADIAGQAFCHELVHCILSTMNIDKGSDEAFVDVFGTFLHHALKTIK